MLPFFLACLEQKWKEVNFQTLIGYGEPTHHNAHHLNIWQIGFHLNFMDLKSLSIVQDLNKQSN